MKKTILFALILGFFILVGGTCKKDTNINIFSIEDDKQLGLQLRHQIDSNPSQYPVLPYIGNEAKYNYLYAMRDEILKSDKIKHKNDFNWELYIIKNDSTLNAFCAPGGYIYVYTGIIKFLDEADHLAGVLGHEIAHADRRHSTQQMTSTYGIQLLMSVLAGDDPGIIAQIAAGLTTLSFSRGHETDADDHSVEYLCDTEYASNGAGAFFQKLISQGQSGRVPAFLSTHPDPGNRVQNINTDAGNLGCSTTLKPNAGWAAFQAMFN